MGQGQIRVPNKGRWAHDNVKLLHFLFVYVLYTRCNLVPSGRIGDGFMYLEASGKNKGSMASVDLRMNRRDDYCLSMNVHMIGKYSLCMKPSTAGLDRESPPYY